MFIFKYIEEIVQYNSNSINLPDGDGLEYLLNFHPRYHPSCLCFAVLKGTPEIFTDLYNINLTSVHAL